MAKRGRRPSQQSTADQLADRLRLAVSHYLPGSRLPVTEELARQFRVSLHTVRLAQQKLVDDGVLESRPRQGFFVARRRTRVPRLRHVHVITLADPDVRLAGQRMLLGIDRHCRRLGLSQSSTDIEHPEQVNAALLERLRGPRSPMEVGWAFLYLLPPEQELMAWRLLGLRFVLVDVDSPTQPVNAVRADRQGAMFATTERLIQLGHRRIGYVGHMDETLVIHRERMRGYKLAMQRHGLEVDDDLLLTASLGGSEANLRKAVLELLGHSDPPTALVTVSQGRGLAVLDICERAGLSVPGDVSVASIGYQRRELADRTARLSRADEGPPEQLGQMAVDALSQPPDRLQPTRLLSSYEWIDGGSIGPPPMVGQG